MNILKHLSLEVRYDIDGVADFRLSLPNSNHKQRGEIDYRDLGETS